MLVSLPFAWESIANKSCLSSQAGGCCHPGHLLANMNVITYLQNRKRGTVGETIGCVSNVIAAVTDVEDKGTHANLRKGKLNEM